MATEKQKLGTFGEKLIAREIVCPRCKRFPTLYRLPNNFKCVDIICSFCGYLAQVKTKATENIHSVPSSIPGGAWRPQKERVDHGIFFPLFLVLVNRKKEFAIYYLPVDFQHTRMFRPRKPLSKNAKRAGWQGFHYDFAKLSEGALTKYPSEKNVWFNPRGKKSYISV
jgi:type II restriction enzyme